MGCDADIGGNSTVHLDLDVNPQQSSSVGKVATGVFLGEMRLDVKPGMEKMIRGGYAGFRSKTICEASKFNDELWLIAEQTDHLWKHDGRRIKPSLSRSAFARSWGSANT